MKINIEEFKAEKEAINLAGELALTALEHGADDPLTMTACSYLIARLAFHMKIDEEDLMELLAITKLYYSKMKGE